MTAVDAGKLRAEFRRPPSRGRVEHDAEVSRWCVGRRLEELAMFDAESDKSLDSDFECDTLSLEGAETTKIINNCWRCVR